MMDFIIGYVIFLFVICVHECAHAWVADRCGDPTGRLMGRVTLDPRAHIDPIGTLLIPLSPLIFGFLEGRGGGFLGGFTFFGWAKPVPVNPARVHRWRRDNMLISFAGCGSGFCIAAAAALLLRGMTVAFPSQLSNLSGVVMVLFQMGAISIWLSLFNLVPIPPLDGYHIFTHLFRIDVMKSAAFLQASGPWLLLFLINTPILYAVLGPLNALLFGGLFRAIARI
jgi:Zn-dependent protease